MKNSFLKNKAKKSFEDLQKEMDLLSLLEQVQTQAGTGVVTGGKGTAEDPYIITSNFYYGDDILKAQGVITGLEKAIDSYNSMGSFTDGSGKYYKYSFTAQHRSDPAAAARNDYIDVLGNGGGLQAGVSVSTQSVNTNGNDFGQNVFGDASIGGGKIGINVDKVEQAYTDGFGTSIGADSGAEEMAIPDMTKDEFYNKNFQHEIAHTLGLDHKDIPEAGVMNNFDSKSTIETKNNSGESVLVAIIKPPDDIDTKAVNKAKNMAISSGSHSGIVNRLDKDWKKKD